MLLVVGIEIRSMLFPVGNKTRGIQVEDELALGFDLIHAPLQRFLQRFKDLAVAMSAFSWKRDNVGCVVTGKVLI